MLLSIQFLLLGYADTAKSTNSTQFGKISTNEPIVATTIVELRTTISQDITSFSANSNWEGVYGTFDLCDPSSAVPGWCYKQTGLSIYDCTQTNLYRYEDSKFVCKLGAVIRQIPDKANPNIHMICDTIPFPGEVEIMVDGISAHPTEKYYEMLCNDANDKAECRRNVQFSLKKDDKGISFLSNKGLDSMTCETPLDERYVGTLKAHYPRIKASFDCAKEGLSKAEKGICNSFYTAREDYMLNVAYNFIMDFADEATAKTIKKEQMQWLKQRNLQCNNTTSANELDSCLLKAYSKRADELKTIIQNIPKSFVTLHSQTGQIPIFEAPSKKSAILYTAVENDKYTLFLADKKSYKDFVKVIFTNLNEKTNPNKGSNIVGYILSKNIRQD